MRTIKITSWKANDLYVGYLNDYPDYRSQGLSKEDLIDNRKELLQDFESDEIPYMKKKRINGRGIPMKRVHSKKG